jgi:uncharacterized protein YjbI with pentapeptide repeats
LTYAAEFKGLGALDADMLNRELAAGRQITKAVIQAEDLIAFLASNTSVSSVRITDSIIQGKLDFTVFETLDWQLPEEAGTNPELLRWYQDFPVNRANKKQEIAVVDELLYLTNCELDEIDASQTMFLGNFSLEGSTIKQRANFTLAAIVAGGRFYDTHFKGPAEFRQASLSGSTAFERAHFDGLADFSTAQFGIEPETPAHFREFGSPLSFNNASFAQVKFDGATFHGHALFEGVRASANASFSNTSVAQSAIFENAHFAEVASFAGGEFVTVDFTSAEFDYFDMRGVRISEQIKLTGARINRYLDLRDADIAALKLDNGKRPHVVSSPMDLRQSRIGRIRIKDVTFADDVDFSDAVIATEFNMQSVTFEAGSSFVRTSFVGAVSLETIRFAQEADFTDAQFRVDSENSFLLSYVDISKMRVTWFQLPTRDAWVSDATGTADGPIDFDKLKIRIQPLSEVIRSLEANFRTRNMLADANAAYLALKLIELDEIRATASFAERVEAEFAWFFWGAVSGYGTKIWWALGWTFAALIFFTICYATFGTIQRDRALHSEKDFAFRLRMLDFPSEYLAAGLGADIQSDSHRDTANKWINAFRLSFVLLFKFGQRDSSVFGRMGPIDLRWVVRLEWLIGYYFLAAVTITLAETQPLLNRLVTGLF